MSREHEALTHVIEAWLDTNEEAEDPESVLDRVIGRLDVTPQRRASWPAWRFADMNNFAKLGIAATLVMVVVVVGSIYADVLNVGKPGPGDSSSPRVVTFEPTSPPTERLYPGTELLAPGPHVITEVEPFRLTITLPGGWEGISRRPTLWAAYSYADGIWRRIGITTAEPPSCVDWVAFDRAPTTIDAFAGERIEITYPRACHHNAVLDALGDPGGRGSNERLTLWVLDVDGVELILYAGIAAESPYDPESEQEALRRLIRSVQIEGP